jgi:2-methylcitrate dehydratase PrpD
MANGFAANALDIDDGYRLTKGHPGACVLPVILAAGEMVPACSGKQFLAALVVGYEIGIRAGLIRHARYETYHASGSWGAIAGAAAAGIKILLKTMGATIEDIGTVYLAGALGNYVHPLSAMRIGLLPMINPEKVMSLGNAASTGANMILLSKHYWEKSAEIAAALENLELSGHIDFFDSFVKEMNFPTENLW